MKTFKSYFTEATQEPLDNWQDLLKNNDMLSTGVNLVREIEKLGGEALIVGGSVRDILLGKPIKDVDIATNVPLDKVKQHFKWNNIGQSGDFGITMIHYGGHEFEVANYRADSETSADNRRPDSVKMVKVVYKISRMVLFVLLVPHEIGLLKMLYVFFVLLGLLVSMGLKSRRKLKPL